VEVASVRVPLTRVLRLGRLTISAREYAVITVWSEDDVYGWAYGLTRGLRVADAARELSASVLGLPSHGTDAIRRALDVRGAGSGHADAAQRAASLLDIALWDLTGRREGTPVFRLLGGEDPRTPCIVVGAYPTGEPAAVLGERLAALALEGHELIKVARLEPAEYLHEVLTVAAAGAPERTRFVVDAAWCWPTAADALRELEVWQSAAPLAWVEDPLPPGEVEEYRRLCAASGIPIGVGDDLADPELARRLVSEAGVAILRIDATTVGGIGEAARLARWARGLGVPISFHIYPETHVHLAAALGGGALTERYGPAVQVCDPAARLSSGGPRFEPGVAHAPELPGLGTERDVEFIAAHLVGRETVRV
jgi:L-alanine-DL-glutamate epimerase-like enolase superfamily enzyme